MEHTIPGGRKLNFPVSKAGAQKIRDVVLKDQVALDKWKHVKDDFVFEAADRLKVAGLLGQHEYQLAVLKTLEIWLCTWSQEKTLQKFLEIIRSHGLNNLAEQLEEMAEVIQNAQFPQCSAALSDSNSGIWFGMTNLVDNFTGRKFELTQLHEFVTESHSDSNSCYTVLTSVYGLGGIGKTSLARKYAYSYRNYFCDNVVWIEAETYQTMISSFQKLGRALEVELKKGEDMDEFAKRIYKHIGNRKCLFIFDNASEYAGVDGIKNFLPNGELHKPHLLITSRVTDIVRNKRVLNLDVLSMDDSINLVRLALLGSNTSDCNKLCETLGRLPLALQQAIAYISDSLCHHRNSSIAISSYLKEYETNAKRILSSKCTISDGYQKTVYLTWQVTLNKLKKVENGHLALILLKHLAYLNPDNIHIDFVFRLDYPAQRHVSGVGVYSAKQKTGSILCVRKSIELLVKFSMITTGNRVIKVHRLVQDVVKFKNIVKFENVNEEVIIERILKCISTSQKNEGCLIHGSVLFPYCKKYPAMKTHSDDDVKKTYQYLSQTEDLLQMITSELVECSKDNAIFLLRKVGRVKKTLKCAMDFINQMDVQDAISVYLNSKEYSSTFLDYCWHMNKEGRGNWSSLKHFLKNEPIYQLVVQLMELTVFLDHRSICKHVFAALVEQTQEPVNKALELLEKFNYVQSIDTATVKVNDKYQRNFSLKADYDTTLSVVAIFLQNHLDAVFERQYILHAAIVYKALIDSSESYRGRISNSFTIFTKFTEKMSCVYPLCLTFEQNSPHANADEIKSFQRVVMKLNNTEEAISLASAYILHKKCSMSEYLESFEQKMSNANLLVEGSKDCTAAILVALQLNIGVFTENCEECIHGTNTTPEECLIRKILFLKFLVYLKFDGGNPTYNLIYKCLQDIDEHAYVREITALAIVKKKDFSQYSSIYMKERIQQALRTIYKVDEAEEVEIIRQIATVINLELIQPKGNNSTEEIQTARSHLKNLLPYLQKHASLASQFPLLITLGL